MRYMHLDECEFDPADSEQEIVFASCQVRDFENVGSFFEATSSLWGFQEPPNQQLPAATYLSEATNASSFFEFLNAETELRLKSNSMAHVTFDEWDLFEVILQCEGIFLRFRWSTTA